MRTGVSLNATSGGVDQSGMHVVPDPGLGALKPPRQLLHAQFCRPADGELIGALEALGSG
jgi:hypothetical protein